jgi:hypothetical protein
MLISSGIIELNIGKRKIGVLMLFPAKEEYKAGLTSE